MSAQIHLASTLFLETECDQFTAVAQGMFFARNVFFVRFQCLRAQGCFQSHQWNADKLPCRDTNARHFFSMKLIVFRQPLAGWSQYQASGQITRRKLEFRFNDTFSVLGMQKFFSLSHFWWCHDQRRQTPQDVRRSTFQDRKE